MLDEFDGPLLSDEVPALGYFDERHLGGVSAIGRREPAGEGIVGAIDVQYRKPDGDVAAVTSRVSRFR